MLRCPSQSRVKKKCQVVAGRGPESLDSCHGKLSRKLRQTVFQFAVAVMVVMSRSVPLIDPTVQSSQSHDQHHQGRLRKVDFSHDGDSRYGGRIPVSRSVDCHDQLPVSSSRLDIKARLRLA